MIEKSIQIEDLEQVHTIFGNFDNNINIIQNAFEVNVTLRDAVIKITGEPSMVQKAIEVIDNITDLIEKNEQISEQSVRYIIDMVNNGNEQQLKELSNDCICVNFSGKPVKPKTVGQKRYVDSIKNNTITFAIGPAGTGKTYLAVALAVRSFKLHDTNKIILTRPAVEAGEKLGFLPGDLQTKVDPYLRPLYDALFEMMGSEAFSRNLERGNIEVAPLAYMRGRTLDESFIILDEAQNTTPEQMKMFLTRLGFNSKMVITGDVTQIDLTDNKRSGLVEAAQILKNVDDISINRLSDKDVIRHKLVQDIVRAYEKHYTELNTRK